MIGNLLGTLLLKEYTAVPLLVVSCNDNSYACPMLCVYLTSHGRALSELSKSVSSHPTNLNGGWALSHVYLYSISCWTVPELAARDHNCESCVTLYLKYVRSEHSSKLLDERFLPTQSISCIKNNRIKINILSDYLVVHKLAVSV